MARKQASDYTDKRMRIMDVATELFAKNGFHATSITDIANTCQTSKSRLYHYFNSKEQVLYEILRDHALTLGDSFLPITQDANLPPAEKLEKFARHLLIRNINFRAKHKLILGELDAIPPTQRQEVATLLRQPIESIFETLSEINPDLTKDKTLQVPIAMMFIGMINWSHTWFSGDGELSPEVFAKLLCDTFLNGFKSASFDTTYGAH